MASLKEIKTRIGSVKNTLKITSAMKLVASAKLHKAQNAISGMLPYNQKLTDILNSLLGSTDHFTSPYMRKSPIKRVAIIALSSNSSLCGAFNNNIIKLARQVIEKYHSTDKDIQIILYPIGRKMGGAFASTHNLTVERSYEDIGEKPLYHEASALSAALCEMFVTGKIDQAELIYTHHKNMAVQVPEHHKFLPIELPEDTHKGGGEVTEYIIEPSVNELANELIPQSLAMHIYATLLDSNAAEHAARTFAMQQATDNGNSLLQELNLAYNKGRQQAITNELLDIVGGTMK